MASRVALVTGASRGIGRATCLALAREGAHVIGVARDDAGLARVEAEVEACGTRFLAIPVDLQGPALAPITDRAWEWQSGIDVLVNAAGLLIRGAEEELTVGDWDATFAVNVRAPYQLMSRMGKLMYDAGAGAIVNVASIAGERVTGAPAAYQASKAALIQLTRFYARRLAPRVRVNAVGPGYVRTDMSAGWLSDPANRRWVEARTPLGRLAEAGEVAEVVAFLASDRASYITGQHVLADGGWATE